MIIAVVSDTHRNNTCIRALGKHISEVDLLIHLGDNIEDVEEVKRYFNGQVMYVRGNCDFSSFVPSEKIEIMEGKKIFLTHGDRYDVKTSLLRLQYKAKEIGADIVLFGHTHTAKIVYEQGIWFINPGSLSLPRGGAASIAILELENGTIKANIKEIDR